MRKGKTRICKLCGKVIQPGGMGGHMALAHEVRVKTIIKAREAGEVRDEAGETRGETRETRGSDAGEARDARGFDAGDAGKIQRPSDYVKKKSAVVKTSIERIINSEPDLGDFERIVSVWTKEADMMRSLSPDTCTIFITGTMKDSVDIYRRKDCPMEKRHWGGLWACDRKECKYIH